VRKKKEPNVYRKVGETAPTAAAPCFMDFYVRWKSGQRGDTMVMRHGKMIKVPKSLAAKV